MAGFWSAEATIATLARQRIGLLALLSLVAAMHLSFVWRAPERSLFGDEGEYLAKAYDDVRRGDTSLLPGRLRFDWRPELASRVYARLAGRYQTRTDVLQRVGVLHTSLLVALVAFTFTHARWLGLTHGGSLAAAAGVGLFPWLGFYVHALWPEILHAFLLGGALLCLQGYLGGGRWPWLPAAGAGLGAALLAKGALNAFLPLAAVYVAAATRWRSQGVATPPMPAWLRGAAAAGALCAGAALVVGPQLAHNVSAGHGPRLAANRWINLELGLTPSGALGASESVEIYERYVRSGETWPERETRARRRVLAHLRSHSPVEIAAVQARKLARVVTHQRSFLELALRMRRWGDEPPTGLAAAAFVGRGIWYALWVLGPVGLLWVGARSAGWGLLALFAVYFVIALAAVPLKPRLALPLVPVWCLFAAAAVERTLAALRRRRAPPPGT